MTSAPPAVSPLEAARRYVAAGLSVIPVRPDGSKAPAHPGWRAFARRRPLDLELRRWFAGGHYGVGIPCGPASGNLIVLDFETDAAYRRWREVIDPAALARLADCPVVVTPSGGRHVWVRTAGAAPAGSVYARRADRRTLIEVRGDGHQVLAPGCPPACHPTGREYVFESTGWLGAW